MLGRKPLALRFTNHCDPPFGEEIPKGISWYLSVHHLFHPYGIEYRIKLANLCIEIIPESRSVGNKTFINAFCRPFGDEMSSIHLLIHFVITEIESEISHVIPFRQRADGMSLSASMMRCAVQRSHDSIACS